MVPESYNENERSIMNIILNSNARHGRKLLADVTTTVSGVTTVDTRSIGEKISDFYSDKNNMAMYLVLPVLFLLYGGCCMIYSIAKCRRYLRRAKKRKEAEKFMDSASIEEDGDIDTNDKKALYNKNAAKSNHRTIEAKSKPRSDSRTSSSDVRLHVEDGKPLMTAAVVPTVRQDAANDQPPKYTKRNGESPPEGKKAPLSSKNSVDQDQGGDREKSKRPGSQTSGRISMHKNKIHPESPPPKYQVDTPNTTDMEMKSFGAISDTCNNRPNLQANGDKSRHEAPEHNSNQQASGGLPSRPDANRQYPKAAEGHSPTRQDTSESRPDTQVSTAQAESRQAASNNRDKPFAARSRPQSRQDLEHLRRSTVPDQIRELSVASNSSKPSGQSIDKQSGQKKPDLSGDWRKMEQEGRLATSNEEQNRKLTFNRGQQTPSEPSGSGADGYRKTPSEPSGSGADGYRSNARGKATPGSTDRDQPAASNDAYSRYKNFEALLMAREAAKRLNMKLPGRESMVTPEKQKLKKLIFIA